MYLKLFSPAKVNFFFKVLDKREDGYHDIISLYQTVSLFDVLIFQKAIKDKFQSTEKDLQLDDHNLIIKALKLFRKETKILDPIEISLEKNIPIEGGLGGGSSNAATTLYALNKMFNYPLEIKQLIEIAKKIGADVPFFFSSGRAFCVNIGDVFEDLPFEYQSFYIVKPNLKMCTKKVFENLDLKKIKRKNFLDFEDEKTYKLKYIPEITRILKEQSLNNTYDHFNDLEEPSFKIDPQLKDAKKDLLNIGFKKVVMTGSGSCFLCFEPLKNIPFEKYNNYSFKKVINIKRDYYSWYDLS